ncbi:hypothetical protein PoB_001698800 [Plakobranchus ocellatus]|uniref:Uncharacterized protein n=1 Tax=Plakobranchus ocellatus TaxID=259542 RepID=A0AAV3Z706_9GAST|nr:hypothetical protein PoB_001698800 [Plakobranchus ocellatus]
MSTRASATDSVSILCNGTASGKPRGVIHESQDEPVSCFTWWVYRTYFIATLLNGVSISGTFSKGTLGTEPFFTILVPSAHDAPRLLKGKDFPSSPRSSSSIHQCQYSWILLLEFDQLLAINSYVTLYIMHPQRLGYRFVWALVVAAPTVKDMSGSSGLLAPSTFPTMTSQMASGMHNAFTSPLKKGVLKLMTALSANSAVLSIQLTRFD